MTQQGKAWAKAYEELYDSLLSKLVEAEIAVEREDTPESVRWSDFDWKTYDTSMNISLDDMTIEEIHIK